MQDLRAKTQARDENQARIDAKIQAREAAKLMEAERRAAENAEKEKAAVAADAAKDGDDEDDDDDDLFGENEDDEKEDADAVPQPANDVVEQPEVSPLSLQAAEKLILRCLRSTYGQTSRMMSLTKKREKDKARLGQTTIRKTVKRSVRIYQMWKWQTSIWARMFPLCLPLLRQRHSGALTSMMMTTRKISDVSSIDGIRCISLRHAVCHSHSLA